MSLLVDSIDHPKPSGATEGTVLGPFHTHEAKKSQNGGAIARDPDGQALLVLCKVTDAVGRPIGGVTIDVWETDSKGFYDVQYADRDGPDGRAVLTSDEEGRFWFKAIVPVPYPIPSDGPVGKLLNKLQRHSYRPSHMHFMFKCQGYDQLITYVQYAPQTDTVALVWRADINFRRALYMKNDPYKSSDAVFGVKNSLVVALAKVEDKETAQRYRVNLGCALLEYNFVLVTDEAAMSLRHKRAAEAMQAQGRKMKFIDGLPIPDVD